MSEIFYRRINNWFLDINKNMIYGDVVLFPVTYPRFVFGKIEDATNCTVTTKLQCNTYILSLGPISPEYAKNKQKWIDYLSKFNKTK